MKISIIIPIYNVEDYIIECLQSVANQTMAEGVECILIDDCGTDNSMGLATDFIANYQGTIKFTMLHHNHNRGLSAARNTGIKAAKGDYVYFLDSDDTIDADCMELMYSYVEKYGNVDLVQGSFYENEEEHMGGSPYCLPEFTDDRKVVKSFLLTFAGDVVGAQSRLIRRLMLLKENLFFKEGIIHEDNLWTFFLAKHVRCMAFCSQATYYHRYNPNSITGNINISKEIKAYRDIITNLCNNIDSFLRGRQMELILDIFIFTLDHGYYENDVDKKEFINSINKISSKTEQKALKYISTLDKGWYRTINMHALIREYKSHYDMAAKSTNECIKLKNKIYLCLFKFYINIVFYQFRFK